MKRIIILFSLILIYPGVTMANNFVCFKDYPKTKKNGIEQVAISKELPNWNLDYLYKTIKDKKIFADIYKALKLSKDFKDKYEKKLNEQKLDANELKNAISEYENILQKALVPRLYLINMHYVDLGNEELKALLGKINIINLELSKNLSFFENGLARTSDTYKNKTFKDKTLENYNNYLVKISNRKKHILPEDHEQLLMEKDLNGVNAWTKFRGVFESKYTFEFKGPEDKKEKSYTLTELTKFAESPKREYRQKAVKTYLSKFGADSYVYAQIYNSLIQDALLIDKVRRGYYPLIEARNLDNQLESKVVQNMHKAVAKNFKLAQKYWELKAKILGIKDFNNADVWAPYVINNTKTKSYSYSEAVSVIQKTLDEFYKPFGSAFENLYKCGLVDAKPKKGKAGGAYCYPFGEAYPPLVLMNFQGKFDDVSTLAHEAGHWLHFLLIAENQTLVNGDIPIATAETASIFNEMLLTSDLLNTIDKKEEKLAFLIKKMDKIIASVYRQTVFSNFEQAVFKASESGPLTPEQFEAIFVAEYSRLFGTAVKMIPEFKNEWARIPHFMNPFYVYAYAFGELATISMYQHYLDNKKTFPEKYMNKFLASGSRLEPVALFKEVGIDLEDKKTWDYGFKYIESIIKEIEKLYLSI